MHCLLKIITHKCDISETYCLHDLCEMTLVNFIQGLADPPGVARAKKKKVDNETNVAFFILICRPKGLLSVHSST